VGLLVMNRVHLSHGHAAGKHGTIRQAVSSQNRISERWPRGATR
jgi:hypothetical protein